MLTTFLRSNLPCPDKNMPLFRASLGLGLLLINRLLISSDDFLMVKRLFVSRGPLLLIPLFILLFLGGCVSTPELQGSKVGATAGWHLKGRVGLKTPQKSGSFNINWLQQGDRFEIYLTSTLGLSIAHLKGNGEGDSRRASIDIPRHGHFEAASAALLLKEHTGLVIPIASLRYWVRGEPAPEVDFEKRKDTLNQSGWAIEYLDYEGELPVRIKLTQGDIKVLLIVSQWKDANG